MFCYTDDAVGIDPQVNIIPFVDNQFEIAVYNKLFLFSNHVNNAIPTGQRVFFDLDLIIKGNIDHIVTFNNGDLTLIDAVWRPRFPHPSYPEGFPIFHHPFNSSCMTWKNDNVLKIWNHVCTDPEFFQTKYHWGMDAFMYYEKETIGVNIGYFQPRLFYSFMYGVDCAENFLHDPEYEGYRPSKWAHITKKIPVVLFNGPTKPEDYLRMFKNHYGDSMSSIMLSHIPL